MQTPRVSVCDYANGTDENRLLATLQALEYKAQ